MFHSDSAFVNVTIVVFLDAEYIFTAAINAKCKPPQAALVRNIVTLAVLGVVSLLATQLANVS